MQKLSQTEDKLLTETNKIMDDRRNTLSNQNLEVTDQKFYHKCLSHCRNRKQQELAFEKRLYFIKVMSKEELENTNYANQYNHLKLIKNNPKHIVKLLGFFENENDMQFIQEKGDKVLYDQIMINNNLGLKRKLEILREVALGLVSFHLCEVAHVDLKLENIMMFGEIFKLIDVESSIDFSQDVFDDVNIKSSLNIMPPELQEFDLDLLGTTIDIWSQGMIQQEVLTSQNIIDTDNQENGNEKIKYFLDNKVKQINILVNLLQDQNKSLNKPIISDITQIFTESLHKDPFKRLTIFEIVDKLNKIISCL